jgi:hypothetical protein
LLIGPLVSSLDALVDDVIVFDDDVDDDWAVTFAVGPPGPDVMENVEDDIRMVMSSTICLLLLLLDPCPVEVEVEVCI